MIGFLTFEDFHAKTNIGSSKIRAKWLINNWEGAELFKFGQKYDAVVYQKVYWVEHAEKYEGIKVLDICDPDWLQWGTRVKQMLDLCDGVSCNTQATADYITNITDKPVTVIPDRIDYSLLPEPKKHEGKAKKVVWYGYSQNFPMLDSCINSIMKLGLDLIVCSNKMYQLPTQAQGKVDLKNCSYSEDTIYQDIQDADICLNPQVGKGTWKYKSNNKTILSQALGVPVAHNEDELKELLDPEARTKQIENFNKEEYDVKKSVEEMDGFIKLLTKLKCMM